MKYQSIFFSFLAFILLCLKGFGQSWEEVSGGVTISPTVPCVYAMTTYKNELYVAGLFGSAGNVPVNNIAKWNGSNWSSVGAGTRGGYANGAIGCMAVYNEELYVGGFFDSAGTAKCNRLAKWNGTEWSAVGSGLSGRNSESTGLYTMTVFNSTLVIGGMFYSVNGIPAGNIASFDGTKWTSLSGGLLNGEGGSVWSLAVHLDSLYVGGDIPGGPIVKLGISSWQSVGSGFQEYATALSSYKNTLYAGGAHIYNDQSGFMRWDGLEWQLVKGPSDDEVLKILVIDNLMYVAGRFHHIGDIQANMIACWDGQNWASVGTGFSANDFYSGVHSLAAYQGYLYAGGNFFQINNIARMPLSTNGVIDPSLQPIRTELEQNFPNPFNPTTTISYSIPEGQIVELTIYNMLGTKLMTLVNEYKQAGRHTLEFNGTGLTSGVYFYRLKTGQYIQSKKFVLLK